MVPPTQLRIGGRDGLESGPMPGIGLKGKDTHVPVVREGVFVVEQLPRAPGVGIFVRFQEEPAVHAHVGPDVQKDVVAAITETWSSSRRCRLGARALNVVVEVLGSRVVEVPDVCCGDVEDQED